MLEAFEVASIQVWKPLHLHTFIQVPERSGVHTIKSLELKRTVKLFHVHVIKRVELKRTVRAAVRLKVIHND